MIEWSKVANDILRYARGVFNEDHQTITDHELKNALNIRKPPVTPVLHKSDF